MFLSCKHTLHWLMLMVCSVFEPLLVWQVWAKATATTSDHHLWCCHFRPMLSQLCDYWIPDLLNLKSVSHIEDKCGDRVWDSVFLECLRCHGVVAQYCRSVLSLSSMDCVCWVNGLHFAWKSQFRLPWSAGEIVPSSLVPFQFKRAQLPVYAHLYKADTSCIPSDSGLTSKK